MKLLAVLLGVLLTQAGDTELRFRAAFKTDYKGNKSADLKKLQQVLETRFRLSRGTLPEPRITPAGDDQILVQIPGRDRDKLGDYKKLITVIGKLELKEVGSKAIHDDYKATQIVPAGYERHEAKSAEENLLVKSEAVITGDDIKKADAQPSFEARKGGAGDWLVTFEMNELAAKKFDEAAKKLFAESPRGRIAIIVDGQLGAAPQVQSDRFNGLCQITGGYSEADARRLAIILRAGALPVELVLDADEGTEKK